MLFLFRKLRKSEMQKKSFVKYFKYAIGEIILVVVGILIALQINNWNSSRIQQNKEQSYLKEIQNSLYKDSLALAEVLSFNKEKVQIVNRMMKIFVDSLNNQQRAEIFEKESDEFVYYRTFEPSRTVFNNLIGTETIDLIRDVKLKNMISNYYEIDYSAGVQERIIEINRMVVDEWFPKFFTKEYVKSNLGMNTGLPPNAALDLHLQPKLLSDLYGITYIIEVHDLFLSGWLERNQELRAKIEQNTY